MNNNIVGQFFWWGKPECPEKTTALSQVTDKLYRLHFAMNWVVITTLVMIGTDYTGNCLEYHFCICPFAFLFNLASREKNTYSKYREFNLTGLIISN
jgi:hypothetical protein